MNKRGSLLVMDVEIGRTPQAQEFSHCRGVLSFGVRR